MLPKDQGSSLVLLNISFSPSKTPASVLLWFVSVFVLFTVKEHSNILSECEQKVSSLSVKLNIRETEGKKFCSVPEIVEKFAPRFEPPGLVYGIF